MPVSSIALLTCFQPFSDETRDALHVIYSALNKIGFELIVAVSDQIHPAHEVPYKIFQIPFRIANYRADSNTIVSNETTDWLSEVDAQWCQPILPNEVSAKAVPSCFRIAITTLREIRPQIAFFWSSGVFPSSHLWHLAAKNLGIPAFCIERGWLPGTWMIDSGGMHAQGDFVSHPILRRAMLSHTLDKTALIYREWLSKKYPMNPRTTKEKSLFVVCGGADWAGMLPKSRPGNTINAQGFSDSLTIALAVDAWAQKTPNARVIYRPHPYHADIVKDDLFKSIEIVSEGTPLEWIDRADAIVCGLSSIQALAVIRGVPLISTSKSMLLGTACSIDAPNAQLLNEALNFIHDNKPKPQQSSLCPIDYLLNNFFIALSPEIPACSPDKYFSALKSLADRSTNSEVHNQISYDLIRKRVSSEIVEFKLNDTEIALRGEMARVAKERDHRVAELQAEVKKISDWARERDHEAANNKSWAQQNAAEIERLSGLLNGAQHRIDELSAWGQNQSAIIAERDQHVAKLQSEVERLSAWGTQQTEHLNKREALLLERQEQIEELSAWGKQLSAIVTDRDQRIQSLQQEVDKLSAWGTQQTELLNKHEALLLERQEQIEALSTWGKQQSAIVMVRDQHIHSLQQEIQKLSAWGTQQTELLNKHEALLLERQEQIEALSAWGKQQSAIVTDRDQRIQSLQQEVEKLSAWGTQQTALINMREALLLERQERIEVLSAWGRSLTVDLAEREGRIDVLISKLNALLRNEEELRQTTAAQQVTIEQHVIDQRQAEIQLQHLEQKNAELGSQLNKQLTSFHALQQLYNEELKKRIAAENRIQRTWRIIQFLFIPSEKSSSQHNP